MNGVELLPEDGLFGAQMQKKTRFPPSPKMSLKNLDLRVQLRDTQHSSLNSAKNKKNKKSWLYNSPH